MLEAQTVEPPHPGFWTSIKESLLGSHQDYTEGSLDRAILLLSVPMVLEMCMESLFGVVDVFWVAHLGADAMATVGLTETALTVVYALALGLSISVTAMVARRVGEKDEAGAATAAVQGIAAGALISIATGALGFAFGGHWLAAMGASDSVVRTGSTYTRIILGGTVTVFQLFLINAVFRGAGDAATAMRTLWIANGREPLPESMFDFRTRTLPEVGTGRIGRRHYHRPRNRRRLSGLDPFVRPQPDPGDPATTCIWIGKYGAADPPVAWCDLPVHGSNGGLDRRGANRVGFRQRRGGRLYPGNRIIIFAILPSWGMSNAAATLVGQNLGAGKPERAEKSVWKTGLYNMLFLGTVGLLFIAFAERRSGFSRTTRW